LPPLASYNDRHTLAFQAEAGGHVVSATLAKRQRLEIEADKSSLPTHDVFPECKGTAYMQCSESGMHTLQSTFTSLSLICLQGYDKVQAHSSVTNACWDKTLSVLEKQPELAGLTQVTYVFSCAT
jgi:hypothetical protein